MLHFTFLLALWASAVGVVFGYSEPGAYEKLFLYAAYVADAQANGGTPQKIATTCKGHNKKKGTRCNFNEFVEWICVNHRNENPSGWVKVKGGSKDFPHIPDIVSTAKEVEKHKPSLTGRVNAGRVLKDGSSEWGNVMKAVASSASLSLQHENVSKETKSKLLLGMAEVHAKRSEATLQKFKDTVAKGKTVIEKTVKEHGVQYQRVNHEATDKANKGWDSKAAMETILDQGHRGPIEALEHELNLHDKKEDAIKGGQCKKI